MSTVEERVASLEARLDALTDLPPLITDLRGDMNRQFTELRADMNRQLEWATGQFVDLRADMNRQFEWTTRQFTEQRADMNRHFELTLGQFTELRGDMNRRFAALDEKGDRHFTWVVGVQVALLLGVVGALVGAYYR